MIFFNQRLVIDNFGKYGLPLGGSNQKMGSQISDSKRDKCGQSRKVLERNLFSDLICEMLKIGVLAFNKGQISKSLKENLSTINTLKDKYHDLWFLQIRLEPHLLRWQQFLHC